MAPSDEGMRPIMIYIIRGRSTELHEWIWNGPFLQQVARNSFPTFRIAGDFQYTNARAKQNLCSFT